MYITGDVIFEIVIFCLFGGIIWGCISGLIGERKGNKWGFWLMSLS